MLLCILKLSTEVIFIKSYKPHRRALNTMRLLISLLALALTGADVFFLKSFRTIMLIIAGVICAVAFIFVFILLPIYFSRTSYTLEKDLIIKDEGMIFFSTQYMKKDAVQYVKLLKTPLSDITSGNFLIINALGGKIIFSFLSTPEAYEIKAVLEKWARGDNS